MSQNLEEPRERTDATSSTSDLAARQQYLTGLRLFVLLSSLTLVTFLVLLDLSIIGTVRTTWTP
jgi:hypothetical protein